jgi:hypothetical protein
MTTTTLAWRRGQRVEMYSERALVPRGTLGSIVGIFGELDMLIVWFDGREIYDLVWMEKVVPADEQWDIKWKTA